MEWINEKSRDPFFTKVYPNSDVEISSSEMAVNDKSIGIFVFCCQRLTQSKLVSPQIFLGDKAYNHPSNLILRLSKESSREFWYRGTHPSHFEAIIKNGIEKENEYFAVNTRKTRKFFEYGNNRALDFEEVGKLITIYRADAFASDSNGDPSDWYKVKPLDIINMSPKYIIGIFASRAQADDFMQKINKLSKEFQNI